MASANRYTTTELLSAIRRTGHVPTSQTPFTDADLLALSDFELQTSILSQILNVRENYYLTYKEVAIASSGQYDIPTRAITSALADIHLVNGSVIYPVSRSEIGEQFSNNTSPTGYYSFYLDGNKIVLLPNPTTGTIRLWYYQRPNTLIPTTSAMQVTGIDTGTSTITVASVLSTFSSVSATDFIKDQPHFDALAIDQTPSSTTATTLVYSSLPDGLAVGDWIALAGQSPVPQIPVEFRALLVQRVVVKYYEIQGYMEKMKAAQEKLQEMQRAIEALINPRVAEEPKRIVPDSNLIGGFGRSRIWRAT